MQASLNRLILGFLSFVLGVISIVSILKKELVEFFFVNTSYFLMLLLVGLSIYQAYQTFRNILKPKLILHFFQKEILGLMLTLILTTAAFVSSPPFFRVLSDESNLLSVSQSFQSEKKPFNITTGERYYGSFHPENKEIPTRPLMFSFSVSLLHEFLGFHLRNVFIFNFLVFWIFLFIVFIIGKNIYGSSQSQIMGVVTLFLTLSFSIFQIYGTGAGFDLYSVLFLLISLGAIHLYLNEPSSERLALSWISLLFFSHIRYESIILVPLFFVVIWDGKLINFDQIQQKGKFYLISFFTFLPLIWQRILTQGKYENPEGIPVISWASFKIHGYEMIKTLGRIDSKLPFSSLVIWLGLLGFLIVILNLKKIQSHKSQYIFIKFLILTFITINFVYLGHHFGVFNHPTQARFFMSFSLFCVFSFLYSLNFLKINIKPTFLFYFSSIVLLVNHGVATNGRFSNSLLIIRESEMIQNLVEQQQKGQEDLYFYERPVFLAAQALGAVDFKKANENKNKYLLNYSKHLYTNIFVLQQIKYQNNKPLENQELDPVFQLETLSEKQITEEYFFRISKVKKEAYRL